MIKYEEGMRVVKARRYSEDKYCRMGGEESAVPIGTEGTIKGVGGESISVLFDNGERWALDITELDLLTEQKTFLDSLDGNEKELWLVTKKDDLNTLYFLTEDDARKQVEKEKIKEGVVLLKTLKVISI